jgi:hypothetical protein
MAFSISGCGTNFYGWSGVRRDGSYIATEWITALYLPIIPLRSFRVRRGRGINLVVFSSRSYQIIEKLPLYWPQVFRAYFLLAWWVATVCIFWQMKLDDRMGSGAFLLSLIGIMALPLVLLYLWLLLKAYLARRERRRSRPAHIEHEVGERSHMTESSHTAPKIAPRNRFNGPRN